MPTSKAVDILNNWLQEALSANDAMQYAKLMQIKLYLLVDQRIKN